MKKALVAALLTVIVLAVSILPAFAETTNASTYENMAYLSPIIYILQNNNFTVQYDNAFSYGNNPNGTITFTGSIIQNYVYTSSMTINSFIKNYTNNQQTREAQTVRYWLNIQSSTATVTLWANDRPITANELYTWNTTINGDAILGISFSLATNDTSTTHTIYNVTVASTTSAEENLNITNDITTSNWPKSQDYYNGYLFANPGTKPQYNFQDPRDFNIFNYCTVSATATWIYNEVPYQQTRDFEPNENTLTANGIKLDGVYNWIHNQFNANTEFLTVVITLDFSNYNFNFDAIPMFRSGTTKVNSMLIYTANNTYNATTDDYTTQSSGTSQFTLQQNIVNDVLQPIIYPVIVEQITIGLFDPFSYSEWFELFIDMGLYQAGYAAGETAGINKGQQSGYQDGFNKGEKQGYNKGFNDGTNNKNTWYNLFFAVVDAPVHIFSSLLNFEIFGVNMRTFALAMLTLGVFLIIIKKVIL